MKKLDGHITIWTEGITKSCGFYAIEDNDIFRITYIGERNGRMYSSRSLIMAKELFFDENESIAIKTLARIRFDAMIWAKENDVNSGIR